MEKELIIPVYLNQKNVFDLIAMMQNGLATVTRINTNNEENLGMNTNINSNFGLSGALASIFKADISASIDGKESSSNNTSTSEERYHTPASLLYILRNKMKEENVLFNIDEEYIPENGDIIEFSSSVRKNPFITIMEKALGMMNIAISFAPDENRGKNKKVPNQNVIVRDQIQEFLTFIDNSKSIDLVSDRLENGYQVVITLEKEFLNDLNMNDLMDGHFKVIGKVIRIINDTENSIELQRKTPVGIMQPEMLMEIFSEFTNNVNDSGMKLPELEVEIKGPVIQILPIAIFA